VACEGHPGRGVSSFANTITAIALLLSGGEYHLSSAHLLSLNVLTLLPQRCGTFLRTAGCQLCDELSVKRCGGVNGESIESVNRVNRESIESQYRVNTESMGSEWAGVNGESVVHRESIESQ
jgi:hypothetical protein